MTVINLGLVAMSASHSKDEGRSTFVSPRPSYRMVAHQEGEFSFTPVNRGISIPYKASLLLNLPAHFFGAITADLLHRPDDAMQIAYSTLFVPFLWYRIGGWWDRFPESARELSRLAGMARLLLRTIAIFFFSVSIFGLTPAYHHRDGNSNFLFSALIFWSGSYLLVSFSGERRAAA